MDHVAHSRHWLIIHALQNRVRELSKRIANRFGLAVPNPSVVRKLKTGVFATAAVTFGLIAHRLNGEETEIRWRKSHVPSARVWGASFLSEGFRSIENPTLRGRITRTLPSLTDSQGHIWSASPDWWAIETADVTEPLVFCLKCTLKPPPSVWKSEGTGWEGLEISMKAAHQQALADKIGSRPGKGLESIDPREIRY